MTVMLIYKGQAFQISGEELEVSDDLCFGVAMIVAVLEGSAVLLTSQILTVAVFITLELTQ